MRIEHALDQFLVQIQADGRSHHTVAQYRRHVLALAAWIEGEERSRGRRRSLEVEEIDHQTLARFLVSPAARERPDGAEKKAVTTNALRTSLRCFFRYLADAEVLGRNPARLIRHARCGAAPPRAMSVGEQERLVGVLRAAGGPEAARDRMLFELMLGSGVRIGSALALEARDIDLERGELHLRRTKGDRREVVVLGRDVCRLLGEYVEARGLEGRDPLFPGRGGRPMSARHAQRRFAGWLRVAEIRASYSPHCLRHTFAEGLYERTGDVLVVQAALGHRAIASSMVYARADAGRVRAAVG